MNNFSSNEISLINNAKDCYYKIILNGISFGKNKGSYTILAHKFQTYSILYLEFGKRIKEELIRRAMFSFVGRIYSKKEAISIHLNPSQVDSSNQLSKIEPEQDAHMIINYFKNSNNRKQDHPKFDQSLHYAFVIKYKNVFCNQVNSCDYNLSNIIFCPFCIIEFWSREGGNR